MNCKNNKKDLFCIYLIECKHTKYGNMYNICNNIICGITCFVEICIKYDFKFYIV